MFAPFYDTLCAEASLSLSLMASSPHLPLFVLIKTSLLGYMVVRSSLGHDRIA